MTGSRGTTPAEDVHAVTVLDGAGRHDERALTVPAEVSLVALPPYAHQLNPVERVRPYLRDRLLSLSVHDDTGAIVDAWTALTVPPQA